jgi:hypothetical protein
VVLVSFAVVLGVPLALGAALGAVQFRTAVRVALGASFPALIALALVLASPFSLDELGTGPIGVMAAFGWLFGFALAPDLRRASEVLVRRA